MRYLVNPVASVRYKGRAVSKTKWKASGFRRNKPTKRQLAARKKFAAMAKARAAASRTTKRATSGVATMARRKRKAAHRRKSVRRVGRSRSRARRTVYAANPRRRRRHAVARTRKSTRRRYRRNPGLMTGAKGAAMSLAYGLGGALGGMALGNVITTHVTPRIFAPQAGDTPQSVATRNFAIVGIGALGVLMFGKKFAPPLVVYSAAIGMLIQPTKALIYAYAPGSTFLGGSSVAMPRFRNANGLIANSRGRTGAYPLVGNKGGVSAYPQVGAYPQATYQSQPS